MGVDNIGARQGYFKNLDTFCPMAFDKSESVSSLCSRDKDDSLFVWSDQTIDELKKYALNRGGGSTGLQKVQLDAVAYLWELCYELLLSRSNNVSKSPGFESLGLRVNAHKRKAAEISSL